MLAATESIAGYRPQSPTFRRTAAFSPTAEPELSEKSAGGGGNYTVYIVVGVILGVLLLVLAVYLIGRWIRRNSIPTEPSDFDHKGEWFDQQEREQIHELSVEFENPMRLASLASMIELSDTVADPSDAVPEVGAVAADPDEKV